jgi:large subunit ribosomal protein L9
MELILKQSVDKLGDAGDLVVVKPGYGRNYLIPQGKAILASPSAKKVREENMRQRSHKDALLLSDAQKNAAKIQDLAIKVGAKAGENGKIFGSVNSIMLADAIKKAGIEVDRKNIYMAEDAIKTVGSYEAKVKLHKEVEAIIKFEVVGE